MRFNKLVLGTFTLAVAVAADLPSGEEVINRFLEATGGKQAYEKRKSDVTTGTLEFVGMGLKGTAISYQAAPDMQYTVVELPGIGKMESGVVNGIAWEKSALQGPRVKSGQERDQALRMAAYNGAVRWRDLYSKVETVAVEEVEGRKCYKLVATPKSGGAPETNWYDVETGLMVKTMSIMSSPMGEVASESLISDYKDVGGVKLPHTVITKVAGQTMKMVLEKVETNVDIPAEKFAPPADIQALAEKQKPGSVQ